ncbi:uncharacterized protein LOC113331278 [Papaver somniferum]|uniref:uncharacterized protein LOC113331278 n=1 Tax=Papaver somniferum TaxID=3469 RepID=UPI000E6FE068|nr:uncharacterized protein LOC113331278 [Papaver somniferum]
MVVIEFKFCNQTISHPVSGSITVKEMISVAKHKCPYVHEELILFGYTVEGISNVINHDLDLRFFIHYCISQGIDLVKFEIQLSTCVDSIYSSSSSALAPASSSSSSCILSDELAVLEDVTDDVCLIKKVLKKSDAWVNILTGVGKLFEGGIKEVKDCVTKYETNSGRKYKLKKSDLVRYTVDCNLTNSDPSKVRMIKSFMKDILADDLRASKKKKTASDVIDLLRMEYGVDLNVTRQLKRFFVAFEASITGFNNYCRPMLFIDCTFLTGEFKGGLMVACGKTSNQEIYPVAFGIVESENYDSWQWFLTNLMGIIREDRPLTIISDHGIGLLKHVPEVIPNAFHSFCLYHMKGNILVPKGRSRQTAVKLFEECYTALTKQKFYAAAKSMSNLKLDPVVAWMMKIPFENWAAHAFLGERWGENTSNIAESFNNVIKHDKPLPALVLVDVIRAKVMEHN